MDALWTKADGTVIPMRLMSDRHLENTILMLRKRGYVSMMEAGPPPPPDALDQDRMAWATKVGSPLLDQLGAERLRRLDEGDAPFDDDEAEIAQAKWAASIRVGVPRPAKAPRYGTTGGSYPPRHSLYGRGDPLRGTWADDNPGGYGPYGSES